ncbi:dimethylsulfonioproprionate lyase family protein [Amaricoccus solimangrovi]|uniref:Transcriptional regulator n=1 Tax=Amaricoccus solimangrovi TaxID=2589815 RepID=A0A501WTM8_9RHOB|nr:dimethylsulfonioproprionate lyase family protein [Amaricoccus solimangrovi]TPE51760.1 transcriptional regulator [Amaricoccus solimangrovi]
MDSRDPALQSFVDAALAAYAEVVPGPEARASLDRITAALGTPAPRRERPGRRLPVCEHLDAALAVAVPRPALRHLIESFRAVEPDLEWVRRASFDASASANFTEGHANAMILGPAGLENRADVWFGVSLLAPRVRYTDHSHAPEETYLVLSEGEFRQGDGAWFAPGIGGSFYNTPFVTHAMRSGAHPLFAFWALWPER